MAFAVGKKSEIVSLIKEYLTAAENEEYESIAIIAYSGESHSRNIIMGNYVNGVGLIGGIHLLQLEASAACLSMEQARVEALTTALESITGTKDSAH